MRIKSFEDHERDVQTLIRLDNGDLRYPNPQHPFSPSHMTHRGDKPQVSHFLRGMDALLSIDPKRLTAWVEPGITMDQLCRSLIQHGLIPAVVPEFKGITVGGAIMGAGLESSSFLHGQFNDMCSDYELVLPGERILRVSEQRHADLYHGVTGSYGSLGRITLAKIQLALARPAVRLCYRLVPTDRLVEFLDEACRRGPPPEFVDAVVLSAKHCIVMEGVLCKEKPSHQLFHLDRLHSPWFIQRILEHAETMREGECRYDNVPLYDYLFRYDRAAFWMGQFATSKRLLMRYLFERNLGHESLSHAIHASLLQSPPTLRPSLLFRLLANWKLSSTALYRVLHRIPKPILEQTFLIQDFYVPLLKVDGFIDALNEDVNIFPLWICPMRGGCSQQILSPHQLKEASRFPSPDFINVGVYGVPRDVARIPKLLSELETLINSLGGRKMLYAAHTYSREQFWNIYDRQAYTELRSNYNLESLPDIYDILTA